MMMLSCLLGAFLFAYTENHSPYLNFLDVVLMSTAAMFALCIIIVFIAAWKGK